MVAGNILGGVAGGATVAIVIKAVDKFSNTFRNATKGINLLTVGLGLAVTAVAGLGFALGKISINSIKLASDFEEVSSKFSVVFQGINKEAQAVADNLRDNFGLSSRASKQLLSDTGDLLSGFGFTRIEALKLSTEVNELAVDLASFTNIEGGAERASQSLTRALLGERESIKTLGIAILETDIKNRALLKGFDATNLTRQQKALITLELAVEQSKNAIGDFERTQGSFANQTRILNARLEDLKIELGMELLPVATELVNKFTTELLPAIKPLIPEIANVAEQVLEMSFAVSSILIPAIEKALPVLKGFLDMIEPISKFIGQGITGLTGGDGLTSQQRQTRRSRIDASAASMANAGATININGDIVGLNSENISKALSNELSKKTSL